MMKSIKHIKFHQKTIDGCKLFIQTWRPKSTVKAVILLIHGIGEHSSRYTPLAEFFCKHGFSLLSFDLRGHGKSQGRRGHIPKYRIFMDDIEYVIKQAQLYYPEKPLFLYGHSMGGNLVINYILRKEPFFTGVIATSPYLGLAFSPPSWQILIAKILNFLLPFITMPTGLNPDHLSHIPQIVKDYREDPLNHDRISIRLYISLTQSSKWAIKHAKRLKTPFLLMHSDADQITSFKESKKFADKAGKKISFKNWSGFYHELHNEPEKNKVLKHILKWIKTVLGS